MKSRQIERAFLERPDSVPDRVRVGMELVDLAETLGETEGSQRAELGGGP
jgi:hypothetical protein